jgi:2C-methyl-D-erythritol 2,4-cyclodiphosphate synthase
MRVGGFEYDKVGTAEATTAVAGCPEAQMEAGVMDKSDGWVVSHAVTTMLSTTAAIRRNNFIPEFRENMAGFYQFLLQS